VLVLGLVLVLFGSVVYLVLSNSLHSGLDDLLHSRFEQLIEGYNTNNGQINLQEQDESGPSQPVEGEIWLLLDVQGKLIQRAGRINESDTRLLFNLAVSYSLHQYQQIYQSFKVSSTNPASIIKQFDYRFYFAPVVVSGQKVGTLVLGRSREAVEETLHQLLLVLLLAAPAALLFSALGGYWLATRAMRPVRTIIKAANEIEVTDLSRRLNLKGPQDELGELAATFDRMIARLEEAFNRQRQFTADASHELRTPLTIIDLEVSRALTRKRTPQEYQRALEIIQSENSYMSRLVGDLLTLARADVGQAIPQLEDLDLSDLVLEVVERLSPLSRQKGVELLIGELPELLICGNHTYLTQMLTNLIENGIKFTSGNGNWVRVVTGKIYEKWAYIRVADDGPGISAEHLPHLFDRFYQVDQVRGHSESQLEQEGVSLTETASATGGSGLGLSIVKWVATSHKGEVKVESQPGVGTVFEVWLPLIPDRI